MPSKMCLLEELTSQDSLVQVSFRWLQNVEVAQRAEEILPYLAKYVKGVHEKKEPISTSFKVLSEGLKDKFLGPKLAFFKSVACEMQPFLKEFQSEASMDPFLFTDLLTMVESLMKRFVKKEAMTNITKVDVWNKNSVVGAAKMDLGYATSDAIRKVDFSGVEMLKFRQDCLVILQTICCHIMNRSPMKYKLAKGITFCDPAIIVKSEDISAKRLKMVLETLVQNNWVAGNVADRIDREFRVICSRPTTIEKMKSFSRKEERLDNFWKQVASINDGSDELMKFFKMILILSHGNAGVERGFSVNKECLVENQSQQSLVAQRQVWDAVHAAGGLEKLNVCKKMIHAARNSRAMYVEAQERNRRADIEKARTENEKKRVKSMVKELQEKKRRVIQEAQKETTLLEEEILCLMKS